MYQRDDNGELSRLNLGIAAANIISISPGSIELGQAWPVHRQLPLAAIHTLEAAQLSITHHTFSQIPCTIPISSAFFSNNCL